MMKTVTLVEVKCPNPFCREVMRTGKAQMIGRIEESTAAELWCAKCKQTNIVKA